MAATAAAVVGIGAVDITAAGASVQPKSYSGANLLGWETVVGDGILARPGQAGVSMSDIATNHLATHSELQANIQSRGVMAHNICFKRIIDDMALSYRHAASFEFRLPFIPDHGDQSQNAQTFEGGMFIWDGSGDRRDHGLGFQWLLNPWMAEYGQIYKWSMSHAGWRPVVRLEPDTAWHAVSIELDPRSKLAELYIDDLHIDRVYTRRRKAEVWGQETAARLQAEIISLDPGSNDVAPAHRAEVRNWTWDWTL